MNCGSNFKLRKSSSMFAYAQVRDPSGSMGMISQRDYVPPTSRRVRTVCVESDNTSPIRMVLSQSTPSGFWQHATEYVSLGLRRCVDFDALRPALNGHPLQCQFNRAGFENILHSCGGGNFILDRFRRPVGM